MRENKGTAETVQFDAAIAAAKKNSFDAILFEPPSANSAALFQITALTVRAPKIPVIVLGSATDKPFGIETIAAGAQDFLPKEQITAEKLERRIRFAIERQHERFALL